MTKKFDGEFLVHDDQAPLIPAGEYEVQFLHHETAKIYNSPKVYLHFGICDGPFQGTRLYYPCGARELRGKTGKNGKFILSKRSKLLLDMHRLYERENLRPDRISLRSLSRVVLSVTVRTVTQDYQQNPLPHALKYSVINSLEEIAAGSLAPRKRV